MTAAPRKAAALFAALGDETRLRVLLRLAQRGPGSIAELSSDADVSRQAVSKHLRVLAVAGLVSGHRRGREHVWRCRPAGLDAAQEYLKRVSAQWDEALMRLQHLAES
ncbi:MAG: metalloregulator ArsR/SmtB family transcription factor [Lysobacterales bacterium]